MKILAVMISKNNHEFICPAREEKRAFKKISKKLIWMATGPKNFCNSAKIFTWTS